jgi:hypothetical protein
MENNHCNSSVPSDDCSVKISGGELLPDMQHIEVKGHVGATDKVKDNPNCGRVKDDPQSDSQDNECGSDRPLRDGDTAQPATATTPSCTKDVNNKHMAYTCDKCEKSFSRKSGLTMHIKVHTGDKPYKCGRCMTLFARKSTLVDHMKVHTGEKPYKCDRCMT